MYSLQFLVLSKRFLRCLNHIPACIPSSQKKNPINFNPKQKSSHFFKKLGVSISILQPNLSSLLASGGFSIKVHLGYSFLPILLASIQNTQFPSMVIREYGSSPRLKDFNRQFNPPSPQYVFNLRLTKVRLVGSCSIEVSNECFHYNIFFVLINVKVTYSTN